MKECKLYDMGSSGPKFTWRGGMYHGGQRIYERLDRALGNEEWKLLLPDSFVKVLPRVNFSDQHPIMVSLNRDYYVNGGRQFRFESAWLVEHDYTSRVKGLWKNGEDIMSNLDRIKCDAKEWKKWNGDRNTRYYHIKDVNRRRRNNIQMLQDNDGNWIDKPKELRELVNNFYKDLFKISSIGSGRFQSKLTYPPLHDEELNKLNDNVTELEIKSVVFSMQPWKAPGPDGFPAGFYQRSWNMVGNSVVALVRQV
ncbi:uncharacterized protein LOC131658074 [Vicia villosa]|uniref:uncharacterized protein LOC131658074 n=1 Tax=Vicia villosa TaxID=3911 RepID=UPI00273C99F8|nr:uncharacterized protein LOC131658074 [Vicia villosa]